MTRRFPLHPATATPPPRPALSLRRLRWVVVGVTLATFAAFVVVVTWQLRRDLRQQVLAREAESLRSVVRLQQQLAEEEWMKLGLTQPSDDRFVTLLLTTRLRGVVSLRLYEPTGQLRDAMPAVGDAMLPLSYWDRLEEGIAFARLVRDLPVLELLDGGEEAMDAAGAVEEVPDSTANFLEVVVPLEEPLLHELGGAAQYFMDGEPVVAEFARIDRGLLKQAALALGGGGLLIGGLLMWAFRRLGEAHRQIRERSEDLARANQELVLAAKTSAIGTISAHLIHGLNNPLTGLEGFVQGGPAAGVERETSDPSAWQEARETTRRLRAMVNEVVTVLKDEHRGFVFTASASDVVDAVKTGLAAEARQAGVFVAVGIRTEVVLSGRSANLAVLVLRNLVTNALEASRPGTTVRIECRSVDGLAEFYVQDEGPGLSEELQSRLFQPMASGKPGGSGIGLALSYQLARQVSGQLDLISSDGSGTIFRLTLPPHLAEVTV